jgi:hypothetical protein
VRTEWLILADAAQISEGKLYMLGGGWDTLTVNSELPLMQPLGIAAAFSVPWDETNHKHQVEIEVQDDDGGSLVRMGFQVEVGRAPGAALGQNQRAQIAANAGLLFQKLGGYVIIVRVNGEENARFPFRLLAGPYLALNRPRGAGQGPDTP